MARGLWASALLMLSGACTSIETGVLSDENFVTEKGSPRGVIQVTSVGFSIFFGLIDVVGTDIDSTTKVLIAEAKAMDADHVEIKSVHTTPRAGVFKVLCALVCFPYTEVSGVAVKQ